MSKLTDLQKALRETADILPEIGNLRSLERRITALEEAVRKLEAEK